MRDFKPTLQPATDFLDFDGYVMLRPLPVAVDWAEEKDRPKNVWQRFQDLPRVPLLVSVSIEGELKAGNLSLDATLSVAMLRSSEALWIGGDRERFAVVVPLPLDLLGVVELPHKRPNRTPKLPVWAAGEFAPVSGQAGRWAALCIGNPAEVRELLSYIHEVGLMPAHSWSVEEVPLSVPQAKEIISAQRPMPDTATRWTPPYHHDWVGEALAKLSGSQEPQWEA